MRQGNWLGFDGVGEGKVLTIMLDFAFPLVTFCCFFNGI